MKSSLKVLLLAAVSAGVWLGAAANEAGERALGDKAFRADDYGRAVSFYESALALSDAANKPEAWAENALRLGKARIFAGDIDGAAGILDEFRKRNPVLSAGTLPGDLLAARGDFDGALKFFGALQNSPDEEQALEAAFRSGCVLICKKRYSEALKIFEKLLGSDKAKSYDFYRLLRREHIYLLIKSGKFKVADEVISRVKKLDSSGDLEILQHLSEISAGNISGFKKVWQQLLAKETPRPGLRIVELLSAASSLAASKNDNAFAVELLKRASDYAPNDLTRQDLLKKLINLQSNFDVSGAGDTAETYITAFPAAKDSGALAVNTAKLLNSKGLNSKATLILSKIVDQNSVPLADRISAADTGVSIAEAAKENRLAVNFYEFLIKNSSNSAAVVRNMSRYAAYLRRVNDLKGSQIQLINALTKAPESAKEELLYMLVEVSSAIGDTAKVMHCAELLLDSRIPLYLACANYELGICNEKSGKYKSARDCFLRAAQIKTVGKYAIPATYSAALMALKLNDFAAAAQEFYDFAVKNPDNARAADALYLACDACRRRGDLKKSEEYAELLLKKYPSSEVSAFKIMQRSSERAAAGDVHGAVSELEELENSFAGNSGIVSESMLMRSRYKLHTRNFEAALKISSSLLQLYPSCRAAAEAALLAGDSEYAVGHYAEAEKHYRHAAAAGANSITGEVAQGKLIDCRISGFNAKELTTLTETIGLCSKLAQSAKLPEIRINARYKLGLCHELAGNREKAVQAYEKLLYDALHIREQGIPVGQQWCLRAMESGLKLLLLNRGNRSLQRGMRLINNMEAMGFGGIDFAVLRSEFRKKISSKRR